MDSNITIVWFRQDLRLSDNPALLAAVEQGNVLPIYILDTSLGAASRWWLHHSLEALNTTLDHQLNVYIGEPREILTRLIQTYSIHAIHWNRCYEPARIQEDSELKRFFKEQNIPCKSFKASLLWEPWEVLKKDGTPYKVFTPFYQKGCLSAEPPRRPLPAPKHLHLVQDKTNHTQLSDLNLLPQIPWDQEMRTHWQVGEQAAEKRLSDFLKHGIENYKEGRNYPAQAHVSRLSPHLHFGEISPHQVFHAAQSALLNAKINSVNIECFLSEIGWREFSYYLLYHFPTLPRGNFQAKFDAFPWKTNPAFLKAWQQGQTGYPIVDAGMRELWRTGYMHNRVRMIVGSFLVKNLLLHWHEGADWFWDCLMDADLASNSASWQWVAGSGADAAPYFRVFNPITQGEKFDPEGAYTRQYVPELAKLPSQYLFQPWEAPSEILKAAGVVLGKTYPKPIVDVKTSREAALSAFASLKA